MWILPSNHPLYSAFVPESSDLNEESKEFWAMCERSLMWRSKPSLWRTWFNRWSKVYWIQHLFTRILKPSTHNRFVTRYTASLPDIRASHSASPASKKDMMIQDTFSRIYSTLLTQYDLFGASLKTSGDTSHWDMTKFTEAFEILVIQLSAEYSRRLKLARHIIENDSSSLPYGWKTPQSSDCGAPSSKRQSRETSTAYQLREQARWTTPQVMDMMAPKTEKAIQKEKEMQRPGRSQLSNLRDQVIPESQNLWATPRSGKTTSEDPESWNLRNEAGKVSTPPLEMMAKKWATPKAQNANSPGQHGQGGEDLQTMVQQKWPTPVASPNANRTTKNASSHGKTHGPTLAGTVKSWMTPNSRDWKDTGQTQGNRNSPNLGTLAGQHHPEQINIPGKRLVLSPLWVAQLMGMDFERTFFVRLETPSSAKQQK